MKRIVVGLAAMVSLASPAWAQEGPLPPGYRPPPPPNLDVMRSNTDMSQMDLNRAIEERMSRSFNDGGMKLSKDEQKVLRALEKRVNSVDGTGAPEAIEAAQTRVKSPDGLFVLGALLLQLGGKTNDKAMQVRGTDMVLMSGAAPAAALPTLYRNQAAYALDANDTGKARLAYRKVVEARPADVDSLVSLAQLEINMGDHAKGADLLAKAISMREAAKLEVPAAWRRVHDNAKRQAAAAKPQG